MMLRRIFGLMKDEIIGGWRKLHNEELHNLHSSQNIFGMIKSRRIIRTGHIVRTGKRHICRVLVEKPDGKGPLRRAKFRWTDSIKKVPSETLITLAVHAISSKYGKRFKLNNTSHSICL
jgi:hypothetical protein